MTNEMIRPIPQSSLGDQARLNDYQVYKLPGTIVFTSYLVESPDNEEADDRQRNDSLMAFCNDIFEREIILERYPQGFRELADWIFLPIRELTDNLGSAYERFDIIFLCIRKTKSCNSVWNEDNSTPSETRHVGNLKVLLILG